MNTRLFQSVILSTLLVLTSPCSALSNGEHEELLTRLKQSLKHPVDMERFEAEVWLEDMSFRLQSKIPLSAKRDQFLKDLYLKSHHARVPPELVLAVISVESDFDNWAISRAGAQGLMQVMPFWQEEIGHQDDNLFNMQTNLSYGITILKFYLDKENGNISNALARYNGSKGNTSYPNKVLHQLNNQWARR